ncbi:ATPase, T2SS/T4P/T4SS family [Halodesulfurarchaeum sp.]|uniref:ATPase, T2SS/T4P/T4SS family n=1 Tax=Halodesulfurarchaeum sp. TaxID=1980530 RepID=UPI001BC4DD0C|nr:type II/IV secretion system ATPase subunit [Halodesulfurarchaeum sp.]
MFGRSDSENPECGCTPTVRGTTLEVDTAECPLDGILKEHSACRRTVIEAIGSAPIERITLSARGVDRLYEGEAVDVLRAASHFASRVSGRANRLATLAREDPIGAAAEASGRAGLVGEVAKTTGLTRFNDRSETTAAFLEPRRIPRITASYLDTVPPEDGQLRVSRVVDSGATVRIYDRPDQRSVYQLEPLEYTLDDDALATLASAKDRLVSTEAGSPTDYRAAISGVAGSNCPVDTLTEVLKKHTAGYGVFEDLFSDDRLSEVFVNAPATENPLYVRVDGAELRTNVTLTERGTDRLAAGLRTVSGVAFSRAAPTIDATLSGIGQADSIRVAGVREPASDGYAFALRAEGTAQWRLQRLVDNGTVSAEAAALLSVAMARGAAMLVAGPRGAGKTTMASALLWELPTETRLLAIEDTPELPVRALQTAGRDVQRLEAASGPDAAIDPATALRTALRFGNGALAVGEVRGEEAAVLYEAMRVGAASDTVIGTIHGDGYDGVKERVVADLGVPESSFAATDLLVTIAPAPSGKRVTKIEEVLEGGSATLFEYDDGALDASPRLERGNSQIVTSLTRPDETYADTRQHIEERAKTLQRSTLHGGPSPQEAHADG